MKSFSKNVSILVYQQYLTHERYYNYLLTECTTDVLRGTWLYITFYVFYWCCVCTPCFPGRTSHCTSMWDPCFISNPASRTVMSTEASHVCRINCYNRTLVFSPPTKKVKGRNPSIYPDHSETKTKSQSHFAMVLILSSWSRAGMASDWWLPLF